MVTLNDYRRCRHTLDSLGLFGSDVMTNPRQANLIDKTTTRAIMDILPRTPFIELKWEQVRDLTGI